MNRSAILAGAAGLFAGAILTSGLTAVATPSDPCQAAETDRAYMGCRFDRLDKELGITPSPSATPTQSVTPSATPSASATQSASPSASASQTPTQSPSATAPAGFPNASNTGVPAGTNLTAYTGVKTITTPTTIDAKTITGTIVVKAPLTVTRSKVTGNFDVDYAGGTLTLTDSEVNGGTNQAPAIGYGDITMKRVNVYGSRVSVLCGSNCDIQSSWLHGQYLKPGSDWHVNGYVSNGGSNVLVKGNTIACDVIDNSNGGGCTGPGASFGDFSPLRNITYDGNLFKAGPGGYCLSAGYNPSKPYGSNPTNIKVINNVFERGPGGKCGYWGAVTSFLNANGNVYSNNLYDNGTPVPPGS